MIIGHVATGTVVHGTHHFGKITQIRRYRRKKQEGKK